MSEIISERSRSTVTRDEGVANKKYRRMDARNEVEIAAYRHLSQFTAPVPRLVGVDDGGIALEYVEHGGDYETALRSIDATGATYALGRAYARRRTFDRAMGAASRDRGLDSGRDRAPHRAREPAPARRGRSR